MSVKLRLRAQFCTQSDAELGSVTPPEGRGARSPGAGRGYFLRMANTLVPHTHSGGFFRRMAAELRPPVDRYTAGRVCLRHRRSKQTVHTAAGGILPCEEMLLRLAQKRTACRKFHPERQVLSTISPQSPTLRVAKSPEQAQISRSFSLSLAHHATIYNILLIQREIMI